jgi:hypothetical protein
VSVAIQGADTIDATPLLVSQGAVSARSLSNLRRPALPNEESTMKTLSHATRIIAVAAAGILTSALLSTIVSIAEPQRSALIAKIAAQPQAVAASAALRTADSR